MTPKCSACGRFMQLFPGCAWRMVYTYEPIPVPDEEIYRCLKCVAKHGGFCPQSGIVPEFSCGIIFLSPDEPPKPVEPAAAENAREWRPIETANYDSSQQESVLLWWPYWSGHAVVGRFRLGRWESECCVSDGEGPTHWMPLPSPPAATGRGE